MTRKIRVAVLATLFVLAWTSAANADPIITPLASLIVSLGASAATAATIATSLVISVVSTGISYVAQSLFAQKPSVVQSYQKMQTGGILPQSFIFGTWPTAGSLVYFNYWAKSSSKSPNAYETRVIALSDLPSTALLGLIVDDNICTYGSGTPDSDLGYAIPEYDKDGEHYLYVKFYDGTQTSADPFLVSKFASDPNRPYTSTRIGKGRTYGLLTIRKNDQNLSESSTFQFIVKGAKWYDPCKDSTAGGSGSHRFDDPSTWDYSENPQLIRYNIRRGVYFGDQWMFGVQGMSASRLPFDNWSAAINDCDTEVDTNAGGTEPQYRCAGELSVDTEPASIDESLMRACNARSIEVGGIYKTTTGVAASPTKSYTDADFIITSPAVLNPYPGLSGTVNGITGHFRDPTQKWQSVDLPVRLNSDLEVIDGNRQLVADINYDCVPFGEQCQRCMQSALDEDRRFRVHNVVWPHAEWENEPGNTFTWTSAEHGYDNKLFRIDQIVLAANRSLQATVREVDPSDYDWNPSSDFIPQPIGSLGPNPVPSQAMSGWEAVAEIIYGDGTPPRASPGMRMSFDTEDIDDVDGVLFEVYRKSDGTLVSSGETPHSVENFQQGSVLIGGAAIKGATVYQVRGKYRPISNRQTDWSGLIDVTTDDVQIQNSEIAPKAINYSNLGDDVLATFDGISSDIDSIDETLTPTVLYVADARTALRNVYDQLEDVAASLINLAQAGLSNASNASQAIAIATQTLSKTITDGLTAEAKARLDLAAIVGITVGDTDVSLAARLTVVEDTTADLVTGKANSSDLSILNAQINGPVGLAAQVSTNTAAIATLDPSSSNATIQQTAAAARGVALDADQNAETLLNIMGALQNAEQRVNASVAFYNRAISVQVTQGLSASADALQQQAAVLQNSINTVSSALSQESLTRAANDNAEATLRASGDASILTVIGPNFSPTSTISAQFAVETSARVSGDAANASDILNLASYFGSGIDGSTTVKSLLDTEASTRASADSALSASISSLTSIVNDNTAAISTEASTRATEDTSLSNAISSLSATVGSNTSAISANSAAISAEATARASGDSSLSALLTTVQAQTDAGTASGLFGVTAISAPSGVSTNLAIQLRESTSDSFESAGLFMRVSSGGDSYIALQADRTYILDSDGNAIAVFDEAGAKFNNALIGNLDAGSITTGELNVALINGLTAAQLVENAISKVTDVAGSLAGGGSITLTTSALAPNVLAASFAYTPVLENANTTLRCTLEFTYQVNPAATTSTKFNVSFGQYNASSGTLFGWGKQVTFLVTTASGNQGGSFSYDFFTDAGATLTNTPGFEFRMFVGYDSSNSRNINFQVLDSHCVFEELNS